MKSTMPTSQPADLRGRYLQGRPRITMTTIHTEVVKKVVSGVVNDHPLARMHSSAPYLRRPIPGPKTAQDLQIAP